MPSNQSLALSITITKDPITRGNVQTITVTVSDAESNEKIEGAIVKTSVKYASEKHTEELGSKTTDSSGQASFSWRIGGGSEPGTFTATVQASASDYESASKTITFEVVAKNDNATLPIANNTIVNDTSRVIVNDTDTNGNETGLSDGEQGDAGSNNGNVTLLPSPPDPCIENPTAEGCPIPPPPPPLDCEEDPTAEGCEPVAPLLDPCEEDPNVEGCTPPPEQEEEVDEDEDVEEEDELEEEEAEADEEAGEEDEEESEPEEDTTEDSDEEG
jgi:hypothetical protein